MNEHLSEESVLPKFFQRKIIWLLIVVGSVLLILISVVLMNPTMNSVRVIKSHGGYVRGIGDTYLWLEQKRLLKLRDFIGDTGLEGRFRIVMFDRKERLPNEALYAIRDLPNCGHIKIVGGCLRDEDLKAIAEIETLRYLDIWNNPVTDEGLMQLTTLPRLLEVNVYDTQISPEGIAEFQRRLPACQVNLQLGEHTRPLDVLD